MTAPLPTLTGRWIALAPLAPDHGPALFTALDHPSRGELARFMVDPPPEDAGAFAVWIAAKARADNRRYYACVEPRSGEAQGFLCLMRDEPAHRTIEIGDVLFTPALQRTRGATEAVHLLAAHVFEGMGYRRLEWKCDTRNAPSHRAARRFGFTDEGVFRQHMLVRGESRDSAWLSMLDSEWPARRRAFEAWLAPENFDAEGRQRASLEALRAGA
ncbi:MAG TPA: GNAT family protein [Beijerinckiaceae bacterium]|jgi:RimJ/RimL family protein N-acetyltransferase